MTDANTIHVRLIGGIEDSENRYVATGNVKHGGRSDSREGLLGQIQHILEECTGMWVDAVDEPGEIEAIELTLSPLYMDILTQSDVNALLHYAPEGEVRLRYSNSPREESGAS